MATTDPKPETPDLPELSFGGKYGKVILTATAGFLASQLAAVLFDRTVAWRQTRSVTDTTK